MTPVASTGTRHGLGDAGKPEALRIRLLGGFQISVGARTIGEDGWRLRKAASLVKLLTLSPGHRLHREVAMDLLWPDLGTRSAANNLRGALHAVRRTLEPTTPSRYLQLSGEELVLCPDGLLWVDVDAFEEAAATSRYSREPAAYRAAIELYTGELLPEDRYEEWAEDRRENLRGTYLALLSELSMLYQEREEYGRAIQALRNLLSEEPADEEAHAGLMRLYALSGRRGEALRQYELLEKALRRELGAEPGAENRRLREEILSGRFPPLRPPAEDRPSGEIPDAGPHNLPVQRSSFVGRERDIVEIKQLLSMTGLLTLTGTGGTGKTRLALEVARDLVGLYPGGVWLVELAPLSEEALVPQEVASTLGIHEQPGSPLTDTLIRTMRQKKLLLVLDNCEHLIDAAARLVDTLLDSCPRLKILATSREPLGVAGEANWKVPTLSVPDAERLPAAEDLTRYESVRLFEERAHLKLPAFEITPDNTRSVAEVCRRLDGIPLAIELATARMGTLAVEQVAERLEDSLKFLTGGARTASPRQQTMRAALEWSYELLFEAEKRLFERLSVFVGGWTLEAAEAVGDGRVSNPPVLDLLCGLVEKSLVVVEASSSVETLHATSLRYRMLEPVRQYGSEKLRESTEEREVRRRHAEHYLSLAERAESELSGPCSPEWLDWLEIEHDNLREALRWSLDSERPELGLRMGAALWWFWYVRGYLTEGRRWLEEHLSRSGPGYSRVRTRAFNGAGNLAMWQGEFEDAKRFLLEALSLSRELNDEEGVANTLVHLAAVGLLGQRDDISVPVLLEEATKLRPKVKDRRTLSNLLLLSAVVVAMRGDLDRSKALHEESLALFREVGDIPGISQCLNTLGLVTLASRDYDKASVLFREDLRISWESDHKVTIQTSLIGLGGVSTSWGQPARAARLWGAAKAMEETFGIRVTPAGLSLAGYEGYLAAARSRLDEEEFAVAWAEGMAMTTEEAVEYALRNIEPFPSAAPDPEWVPADRLTRREQEVAVLVGQGMTNRHISSELSISERTVETHVRNILKKLGLTSRAQIAARTAEQPRLD